jgi:DNA-binding CsgD family transcriptional regulator
MQHAEALAQLAATEALAGDSAEARDHAGQSLRIVDSRSAGATELRLTVGHALARTALDAGRPSEAVATLQPLVDKVIADGLRDPAVLPCVSDLMDAYFALDRRADAADLEAWLAETARLRGRRWALLAAARAAALRSPQSELQNLRRALDDDCGATLLLTARAWLTYGELVRRSGERRVARDALLRADRAFRQAGARAWYARVAAELRACGEPTTPTQDPSGGTSLDLLTPQEFRVARLAGTGARNREIAQTLSLSEKTVETHLAAAFRKLGIRSRTELAARFAGYADL